MENGYSDYMNPTVDFYLINHVYTKTQPKCSMKLQGFNPLFSIWQAKHENEYPPVIVLDKENKITGKENELCLKPVDQEQDLLDYTVGISPKAASTIIKILKENGVFVPEDSNLYELMAKSDICFFPSNRIKDIYKIEEINWPDFVEKLIRWEAEEKDQRLNIIHKSQLLKGINQRLNNHVLLITNPGTGKSIHYQIHGEPIDKATKKSFLGYARSPTEVFKGTVDGSDLPFGIDQIEVGEWGILDYMFNIMELGEAQVSAGAVKFKVRSKSPFALIANPLSDKIGTEQNFGYILDHLTKNPAIGRRFGVICYTSDYATLTTRSTPESMRNWKTASALFRSIEEYAKPRLEEILEKFEIWEYVQQPIEGYQENMQKISEKCNDRNIKTFLLEHAKSGQMRVRVAALQCSLVDHLKDIALKRENLQEIIEHAEEIVPDFTQINLESANNIVQALPNQKQFQATFWLEGQPQYKKEIIYGVEHTRRQGIIGHIFYLNDCDYIPKTDGYNHITQCISKLVNKKKGLKDYNEKCREHFGFTFVPDGTRLQVYLEENEPMKWIEIPGQTIEEPTDGVPDLSFDEKKEWIFEIVEKNQPIETKMIVAEVVGVMDVREVMMYLGDLEKEGRVFCRLEQWRVTP